MSVKTSKISRLFAMASVGIAGAAAMLATPTAAQTISKPSISHSFSQKAQPEVKTEAKVQAFIAQFPAQFRPMLEEYSTTKTGGPLLQKVASQDSVVVKVPNAAFFMSNGMKDGVPRLSLTENTLSLDPNNPVDRVNFMVNLTNELSTMSGAKDVWGVYIDRLQQNDRQGAINHMLMVEMTSDAMQLNMVQELVNDGHYSLDTVEKALHNKEAGSGYSLKGAMNAEDKANGHLSDEDKQLLTDALWWKHRANSPYQNRVDAYLNMHGTAFSTNLHALDDLKKMTGYDATGAARRANDLTTLYDELSGETGFAARMSGTLNELRDDITVAASISMPAPSRLQSISH